MSIMTEKKLYINCTHQYVPDEKYKTVFSECKQVFFSHFEKVSKESTRNIHVKKLYCKS